MASGVSYPQLVQSNFDLFSLSLMYPEAGCGLVRAQNGSDDETGSRPATPHLSTPVLRGGGTNGSYHPFNTLVHSREDGTHAIHGDEAL